jgi:hypothetical protein
MVHDWKVFDMLETPITIDNRDASLDPASLAVSEVIPSICVFIDSIEALGV